MPLYTFGGAANAGQVGAAPALIPGNLNSALERAGLARAGQKAILENLNRTKTSTLVVR